MLEALPKYRAGAMKIATGKIFSSGVAPAGTPSSSTVAPGGLLVILSDWAKEDFGRQRETTTRNNTADKISGERRKEREYTGASQSGQYTNNYI
jgi:hypothetical protein